MKHLKVITLALVSLSASSIAASSASAALPEFLSTIPNSFVTKSESITLQQEGGITITCKKSLGSGTIATPKAGTFSELFEGCTSLGISCTGLLTEEKSGNIKVEGTYTFGFELGTLNVVKAMPISEAHLECAGVLTSIRGCLAGKATPLTMTLTSKREYTQTGGKQALTDYTSDSGATVSCKLEAESNGGAFKPLGVGQIVTVTYSKAVELMD